MQKIVPIILAGGVGTRLWPLSRKSFPKQFRKIASQHSLFQESVTRFKSSAFKRSVVITNQDYRFHVVEQMGEIGSLPELILLEPFSRNTAPAVLSAVLAVSRRDPDEICLVTPADHLLPDVPRFERCVCAARDAVDKGQFVTFGIKPDRAETGYGYLELEDGANKSSGHCRLKSFTEKPDHARAAEMLVSGRYLWNAGIFMFRAADMIRAYQTHAPEMISLVQAAIDEAELDLGFTRLSPQGWKQLPDVSIDHAIMEKADNLSVVPFDGKWADLGSWQGIWREYAGQTDEDGTVTLGNAHAIDTKGSLLYADNDDQALVGLGLKDVVAVAMKDAVLVANRHRADDVGKLVTILKSKGIMQASVLPRDYRPWGWFENLMDGPGFQVKMINVHPGGVLSLQSHEKRAEHWVVVQGTATVTIADECIELDANQSAYVPTGVLHRLENNSAQDVVLIEVQTGSYLGEDDIVRYEDAYARD